MAKQNSKKQEEARAAAHALELLFASGYISRRKLYFENFMRGIFFSVGSVLGATLVIALLLWLLSLFNDVPFVGDIVRNIQTTVETPQ